MTDKGRPDWRALVARAQPRRKSVVLCLRGDLLAERDAAGDAGDTARAEELQAAIDEATFTFQLRGLALGEYRALEASHPDPDGVMKFNPTTFLDALTHACLVEPQMTRAEYDDLCSVLTPGQWEELREAAWTACNEVDALPLPRRG